MPRFRVCQLFFIYQFSYYFWYLKTPWQGHQSNEGLKTADLHQKGSYGFLQENLELASFCSSIKPKFSIFSVGMSNLTRCLHILFYQLLLEFRMLVTANLPSLITIFSNNQLQHKNLLLLIVLTMSYWMLVMANSIINNI